MPGSQPCKYLIEEQDQISSSNNNESMNYEFLITFGTADASVRVHSNLGTSHSLPRKD